MIPSMPSLKRKLRECFSNFQTDHLGFFFFILNFAQASIESLHEKTIQIVIRNMKLNKHDQEKNRGKYQKM